MTTSRIAKMAWRLGAGLVTLVTACGAAAQSPSNAYSYSRTSGFSYNATTGLLATETVEPNNPQSCVVTTYGLDAYGNKTSVGTANCAGATGRAVFAARAASSTYVATTATVVVSAATAATPVSVAASVPAGQFADTSTNALNQSEHRTYDPRFGTTTALTGPNGLTTRWSYDLLGRKTREQRADGTSTVTAYCYIAAQVSNTSTNSPMCAGLSMASSEVPADAVLFIHTEAHNNADVKNGPFTRVYMDRSGRKLRTVSEAFDGATQVGGASRLIVQDTDYNPYGVAAVTTQPYFLDSGRSVSGSTGGLGMSLTVVDQLGRPKIQYVADNQGSQSGIVFGSRGTFAASMTQIAYAGLKTTTTNDKGQTKVEEKNVIGQVVRVTDALGAQLAQQYDAFGNLVATRDALQNGVVVSYDIRGRKTSMSDPDTGLWSYDYDALGEQVWQQSANQLAASTSTTVVYDVLGRVTQRVEPEYTSTWTYDSCTMGVGKLCHTTTSNGLNRTYVYDSLGRSQDVRTDVTGGPTLATQTLYDNVNGRVSGLVYPTGLQVMYGFTAKGYLLNARTVTALVVAPRPTTPGGTARSAGTTLAANTVLWQALSMDAWGHVEKQQNNIQADSTAFAQARTFDPLTGRVMTEQAGPGAAPTSAMNLAYVWDSLDHLTQRTDNNGAAWVDPQGHSTTGAVTDSLAYDNVGRLQVDTVAAPGIPGLMRTVEFEYNALGMLLYKSDVGVYSYPASGATAVRPHAVQSVNGAYVASYTYDANGNAKTASAGAWRNITYTSFNLPDGQSGIQGPSGGPAYTWLYDENHARFKELRTNASGTRTTWLLHPDNQGGLGFEREEQAAGNSNRHFITAGGMTIGVIVTTDALPTLATGVYSAPALSTVNVVKLEFWHTDRQGSLMATSDHTGAITAIYAYDPFGKRRNRDGEYDATGALVFDWTTTTDNGTPRGYTGHEHLDDVELIHMNGRLYDPVISRFTQGDPFIADPNNLQDYDRFSYCMNTPETCTDPSGYWHFFGHNILPGIFHNKAIMSIAAIAVAVALEQPELVGEFGVFGGLGDAASLVQAATAGFASGAIATGNIKGALEGAVTSVAFYGVGSFVGNTNTAFKIGESIALHGVVGCVSSAMAGGKCGSGALSAAFSDAVTLLPGMDSINQAAIGGDVTARIEGTAIAAIAGGTVSMLGGGKFANGAETGAAGYLFNQIADHSGFSGLTGNVTPTDAMGLSQIQQYGGAAWASFTQSVYGAYNLAIGFGSEVTPGFGLFIQGGLNINLIDGPQLFWSLGPTVGYNEVKVPAPFIAFQVEPLAGDGFAKNLQTPLISASLIQNSDGNIIGGSLGTGGPWGGSMAQTHTCTYTIMGKKGVDCKGTP